MATENELLEESISTCRFAQRVALIRNDVRLNEAQDPYLIIERLKAQIAALKTELALLRGGTDSEQLLTQPLTLDEREACKMAVKAFLAEPATGSESEGSGASNSSALAFGDLRKVQFCFSFMKQLLATSSTGAQGISATTASTTTRNGSADNQAMADRISRLERQITHRDNEISTLY